ncbi:MAG TPA: thioesterase, partial [Erythrobacter sp.]|nr:thioesterase [Erythrobacter sp.]
MSAKPFTFPIKVLPDDIDFMGHVNNARYLNWVQDTVLAHWQKLAPAEEVASKAWVALKHEITYRRPAFLD